MNVPRFDFDVREILDELGEHVALEGELEFGTLVIGGEEFHSLEPARLDVTLTNTGAGLVVSGSVTGAFAAMCSRCLEEFALTVTGEVEGFYVTPAHAEGLPDEQDYELIAGHVVDLGPALLGALIIELPFAPLHDPECAGICPSCGEDRSSCACPPPATDSPFAVLRDLLPADE